MRLFLLLLLFASFSCAAAAVGLQQRFAAGGGAHEPQRHSRVAAPADSRLFLSKRDSEQLALNKILPKGTRSILKIQRTMRYGDFVWRKEKIASGPLIVRVNLKNQIISVFRGGHEIGTAVILYGAQGHDTPRGLFPITAKLEDHHSATYDAPMPFTLRLTEDGVAVHGSEVRWGAATHGCIGVPLEFARFLFQEANVGDVIEIVDGGTDPTPSSSHQAFSTIS